MSEPDNNLLAAILPDAHHRALRPVLLRFLMVPRFRDFVREHQTTVAHELRTKRELQDCLDVVAELEFACLLSPHFDRSDYQLLIPETGKSLDFVLEFSQAGRVGVEVKRIREPPAVVERMGEVSRHCVTSFEIPYTQKESFKFTDRILEALRQLHPELPNVVCIKIDSSTHETDEALEALTYVVNNFDRRNEEFFKQKGFVSRDEFLTLYRRLSVVIVRSIWMPIPGCGRQTSRNRILVNPDANLAIPECLVDVFRHADL